MHGGCSLVWRARLRVRAGDCRAPNDTADPGPSHRSGHWSTDLPTDWPVWTKNQGKSKVTTRICPSAASMLNPHRQQRLRSASGEMS
ncbi:hypothetical protein PDR5_24420 [Pseudomonas sp. DR 5-09]|nr:hypothetical protein PDR5_24420 [Pseudomonas sp. DR 5-09]